MISEALIPWMLNLGIICQGPDQDRVYLTYDDGPDPEVTPLLLEILKQAEAKATFFVLASPAPGWADQIRAIAAAGHAIGLHGLRHRSSLLRGNGCIHGDLLKLKEMIAKVGVPYEDLWRPPYGHVRPDTVKYLKRRDLDTVLWSSLPGDYRKKADPEKLLARALSRTRPGGIIALHDGAPKRPAPVLELTRRLLEQINCRGWQAAALRKIHWSCSSQSKA